MANDYMRVMTAPKNESSKFVVYGLWPEDPLITGHYLKEDAIQHAHSLASKYNVPIKVGQKHEDIYYLLLTVVYPNGARI